MSDLINALWDDNPVDITSESNLIWSIANKLRGSYMPDKYGDVIIPMTIIRRFECALADTKDKVVFDLYSGTGTIAQILAPVAKHVTGVEIVAEAVEAAIGNAQGNHLANCDFICGDVLKVVDELKEKPDMIVLDPPREGIHPKAMPKILRFGVDTIVYISCKATSLKNDLAAIQAAGYRVKRCCTVDLFPGTVHVETVVVLRKQKSDSELI